MTVSSSYWYFLIALAAAALITRLAVDALPVRAISYRPGRGEAIWAAGSVLALAVHCTAMFFPSQTEAVPGLGGVVGPIGDLGLSSQLAYAIPATILVVALRRSWWPAIAFLAAALTAVGVTMYWSFGLTTHLTAIAFAVTGLLVLTTGGLRVPRLRLGRA
jgi:hypothetical protein